VGHLDSAAWHRSTGLVGRYGANPAYEFPEDIAAYFDELRETAS